MIFIIRLLAILIILYLVSLKWDIYNFQERSVVLLNFEKGDLTESDLFQEIRSAAAEVPVNRPSADVQNVFWDNMGGEQAWFSIHISYRGNDFTAEKMLSFHEEQLRYLRSEIFDQFIASCEDLAVRRWLQNRAVMDGCMQKAGNAATSVDGFRLTIRSGVSPSCWRERFSVYVLLLVCFWCAMFLSKRALRYPN